MKHVVADDGTVFSLEDANHQRNLEKMPSEYAGVWRDQTLCVGAKWYIRLFSMPDATVITIEVLELTDKTIVYKVNGSHFPERREITSIKFIEKVRQK